MTSRINFRIGLLTVLVAIAAMAGCGGGSEGPTTPANSARPSTATKAGAEQHHDSGGGSAQFIQPGDDNSIQRFGTEAGPAEFEAAAAVLHGFFDARARRDWEGMCRYLSEAQRREMARFGGCAKAMEKLSGGVPTPELRKAAIADVGSLRREGASAFLIYRAAGGDIYAIPVVKEKRGWKVAALAGTPLS